MEMEVILSNSYIQSIYIHIEKLMYLVFIIEYVVWNLGW